MNRPIEFRAWDIISKKWRNEIPASTAWFDTEDWDDPEEQWEYLILNPQEPMWHTERMIYQQYTGLKDRKGNKIFEGDIVRYPAPVLGPEDVGEFDILLISFKNGSFYMGEDILWNANTDCEIIGNIFEQPELIINLK